jgi:hypothetical protein
MYIRAGKEREQYASWLQKYHWDYFLTCTFRKPRREPYYALKHVWQELRQHNVKRGFLACEPHESSDIHIHGIIAGNYGFGIVNWKPEMASPFDIWHGLFKRFGRSKVELCNSHEAVTAYCSKYILKQQSRVLDYYEVYGNKYAWDSTNYEFSDKG